MSSEIDIPMDRIEFHRHGLALLPKSSDKSPGLAVFIADKESTTPKRFCSCKTARSKTCRHLLEISRVGRVLLDKNRRLEINETFRNGLWFALAVILADGNRETPDSIKIEKAVVAAAGHKEILDPIKGKTAEGNAGEIRVIDSKGRRMGVFYPRKTLIGRFLERCGNRPADTASSEKGRQNHRGSVLKRLVRLTLGENERVMNQRGFRSRIQGLEESFWYFAAYHHFLEYDAGRMRFRAEMDASSGDLYLCGEDAGRPVFRIDVPREKTKPVLEWFQHFLPGHSAPVLHAASLHHLFKVRLTAEKDLEVIPLLELSGEEGAEPVYFTKDILQHARYGDLVYLEEQGMFVRVDPLEKEYKTRWAEKMVVKRDRVPAFLDQFRHTMAAGPYLVDSSVGELRIFKSYDSSVIHPKAMNRDWCWLSMDYGFGNARLSLAELLEAKKRRQRFIETPEGWVDLNAKDLEGLDSILDLSEAQADAEDGDALKLSRKDLFRVQAAHDKPPEIRGEKTRVNLLRRMLELKASRPLPTPEGLKSDLRAYQHNGVQWAWFLYENGLGGILCDDMGLGKTHQSMALMLCILESEKDAAPFLVVCPTTVLSHWQQKIEMHAPELKPVIYHGADRDFDKAREESRVILTSYGLLRRDITRFESVSYPLVIFDEIQHIKNAGTLAYGAAEALKANFKLGLTGTPIENSLSDIKALMDLTLPGYLGGDGAFKKRYVTPLKSDSRHPRQDEFRRLISPFTLRRLKTSVLPELPEKIEDLRFCRLRGEQVKLYRDAVDSQGRNFLAILNDQQAKVPYIHIFALLNLLKQICNHPALLDDSVDNYRQYKSGKWELFKELLDESLGSGQKVVVYSQFLGMIKIIEDHLKSLDVGYVTLTGASRKRGEIISTFNEDPNCRVYVGSLKAGGTGVDLVAGSVVIHYDRWWNAAKEDQATDRVHRIGQKRGVQVFKLVTQGTMEEKISAIIEKKRHLMDAVIKEDDPGLLKSFSRQELIEILSQPIAENGDEDEFPEE